MRMNKLLIILFVFISASGIVHAQDKVRILIVPGHDDEYSGAEFGSVKEVELNRIVAKHLGKELSQEDNVQVIYAHDNDGYSAFLEKYFKSESKKIDAFRKNAVKKFQREVSRGNIQVEEAVPHGTATPVSAKRLYAINKWANENKIDLVLHIHFNDYGSRTAYDGAYSGFSVYVPHRELKNSKDSIPVGQDIYEALSKISYPSNNPTEAKHKGAIEDHELIALGANNTLDVPSVLIEYAYIYEPQIQSDFFNRVAEEYAHTTYLGLADYLGATENTALMKGYEWKKDIKGDAQSYPTQDVYMLQTALKLSGSYAASLNQKQCPLDGVFRPCTKHALMTFQKKQGIPQTGLLDSQTRKALSTIK
jgi:N-acetylmuramoyl-L-alanine amidase